MLLIAGVVIFGWFHRNMGPSHPAFALLVAVWTSVLTPAIAIPTIGFVTRLVPRRWFRVPAGERILHRMFGVGAFGWLLERSGYNRRVADPLRGFDGTRAGLPSLEQSVRGSSIAHGTGFSAHLLLAVAALQRRANRETHPAGSRPARRITST